MAHGREQGLAQALLTVLEGRGIEVDAAARARIVQAGDPAILERWIRRALTVTTVADVLDD